ncbi:uncharacterized protein BX664DRAFT_318312 [Halteromyces radiatus]|uniref:uncharacterized protein n=1 Tax=Halteromyces radiatus TaxID=101107 RepID=UPI00221EF8F3|nr:uncharacterized protein BX664DRAFT_318312 [Halteromyces radiatus]KAI8077733.1 hypothetical protein BX664DRAFT_318312 [Halteromyces radiatus]
MSSLQVKTFGNTNHPLVADDGTVQFDYIRPLEHSQQRADGHLEITRPIPPPLTVQQINKKYCGYDQCRFILPIAITEQESKAQYHFRQLAFLSGKLKRTIVLPNVHSSHLGACRQHPFDFYYDYTWLDKNKQFFNYITMEQFQQWIQERHTVQAVPSGQEVFIEIDETYPHLAKSTNCFQHLFDFTYRPRRRYQLEDPELESKRIGNYTEILLNALGDDERRKDYQNNNNNKDIPDLEVIHLFYDRRFGYIEEPQVEEPLGYHQRWTSLADQIAKQLQPFVAIHWRMERLEPVSNMQLCAEELVRKLDHIDDSGKKNVFLLTDYPHLLTSPLAKPESMSFKLNELRPEHHDAIRYLYERTNVTLTTLQRQDIPYDDLPKQNWNLIPVEAMSKPADKSILGIVDKLVAIRAQWFLYGQPGVCGKDSSFTRRIQYERITAYQHGDPNIMSPFDTFKLHV